MSSTCFLNPPIIRGEIWGLQRLSSMFKVTQMVWGRGRIWTRGSQTPYPRISGHFTLILGCASEAAKSLWFMEHIVLGVPSVSPSCFSSPPPTPFLLPHSTQSCNPIHEARNSSSTALSMLTETICLRVSFPDGTGVAEGQGRCYSPLKTRFTAQCLAHRRCSKWVMGWNEVFLGHWGICCVAIGGLGQGVQNNLYSSV